MDRGTIINHIKSRDLCERCIYSLSNCKLRKAKYLNCDTCKMKLPETCRCTTIDINTPCPYFKEYTENGIEPEEIDAGITLESAIQHCNEAAGRLRKSNPCDPCASECEQLARWLEELKKLRAECEVLRSNWYKCAERVKKLQAELNAAISDLRKFAPTWKLDGEKEQSSHEETSKCGCVDFG